jgi:hypothetical protein
MNANIDDILKPRGCTKKLFKPAAECDIECDICNNIITVSFARNKVVRSCESCRNSPNVSKIVESYNKYCESQEDCKSCHLGWNGICDNWVQPPAQVKMDKPYNDTQPERIFITNPSLQRMPPLAGLEGILPEFQKFFDSVVEGVIEFIESGKSSKLYLLSDKALSSSEFEALLQKHWKKHSEEYANTVMFCRGFDVELNMERFHQDIHRNMLGGLNVMTYTLSVDDDEFSENDKVTGLKKSNTELLFTYRPFTEEFLIISKFSPFKGEDV